MGEEETGRLVEVEVVAMVVELVLELVEDETMVLEVLEVPEEAGRGLE